MKDNTSFKQECLKEQPDIIIDEKERIFEAQNLRNMMSSEGGKWLQNYFDSKINLKRITTARKEDREQIINEIDALEQLSNNITQIINFKPQEK